MVTVKRVLGILIIMTLLLSGSTFFQTAIPTLAENGEDDFTCRASEPSGGSYMLYDSTEGFVLGPHSGQDAARSPAAPAIGTTFDSLDFDDNVSETGSRFIPADPIGAASTKVASF
jgi:hypothetical protein